MKRGFRAGAAAVFLLLAQLITQHSSAYAQAQDAPLRAVKNKILPEYPEVARHMKLTGKVRFEVAIAPDGSVLETHCVGGSPVLADALDKVLRKWKFAPGPARTKQVVEVEFTGQ
jgi:TonB family protein